MGIIISTISLIIFVIILVATFFTVAYSCRMSFLLASLYTAKNCTYISDDNDYLMINGLIFLFPPTIFLPVWLKIFILFLIFIAVIRGLIRLKTNKLNKFSKYLDFFRNSYFLNSIFILIIIIF